jgi:AraC family transcriptional regulator
MTLKIMNTDARSALTPMQAFTDLPFTPAHTPLPIFPQPPLLSSQQTAWNGIYVEHHRQPAYETPDYCYGWCIVSIHLGQPITVEKWVEGEPWQSKIITEGDIGIYPANIRLRERCHHQTQFIDLYLNPSLFAQAAQDLATDGCQPLIVMPCFAQPDPLIYQMGLALKAELEVTGEKLYAEAMATALVMHLLQRYSQSQLPNSLSASPSPLPHPKLPQAIDYIQAHLSESFTIAELASTVQMSPYHFSRCFKQSTGLSPHQYILQQRIESAKRLLSTSLPLIEVAYQAGFATQSHFNRHFKRIVGLTPTQFRHL